MAPCVLGFDGSPGSALAAAGSADCATSPAARAVPVFRKSRRLVDEGLPASFGFTSTSCNKPLGRTAPSQIGFVRIIRRTKPLHRLLVVVAGQLAFVETIESLAGEDGRGVPEISQMRQYKSDEHD